VAESLIHRFGSLVRGPSGSSLLRTVGGLPGSCCCGPKVCDCNTSAGCLTNSAVNSSGIYRVHPAGGGDPYVYTSGPTPATCCCGPGAGQRYRSFRSLRRLCANGGLRQLDVTNTDWDGATNEYRVRRTYYEARPDCSEELTSFTENNTFFPPVLICGAQGSIWAPGHGGPLGGVPLDATSASGTFVSSCNTHDEFLQYVRGGELYEVIFRAAILPNNTACLSGVCLKTCCFADGSCQEIPAIQCLALGGTPGVGQFCYEGECEPGPNRGACCIASTGSCTHSSVSGCQSPNIFHGLGSTCAGLVRPGCPEPTGRCCVPDGGGGYTCSQGLTPTQCNGLNGVWGGWQSTCASNPCPGPTGGACCKPDGSCEQVPNPQACIDLNGTFFSGGNCQATQCTGSCCTNGVCSMVSQQVCVGNGGTFVGGISCNPDPCNVSGACCCNTSHGPTCGITTQSACLAGTGCTFLGPGTTCDPFPCGGGTTESPFLSASHFARGFSRGFVRGGLVLRDGTPASTLGTVRGCSGCGGSKGTLV
jgi:hypothetical protein